MHKHYFILIFAAVGILVAFFTPYFFFGVGIDGAFGFFIFDFVARLEDRLPDPTFDLYIWGSPNLV
jgi:hypothetical protein